MAPTTFQTVTLPHPLWFVRHGATQPNLDRLRCGGDLDVEMTDLGREQIKAAADKLRAMSSAIELIVCSDLMRTDESARMLSLALGGCDVLVLPGFRERMLGRWNLVSVTDTEAALQRGDTPPGGESAPQFADRIAAAMRVLADAMLGRHTLLVGSRGVARILNALSSNEPPFQRANRVATPSTPHGAGNGEVLCFDFTKRMPTAAQFEGALT